MATPDTDDEPEADEPERGPLRRCAVTRERQEKAGMIRFVISPERVAVVDVAGRLPGRGIWLSARRNVIELACTKGAFARAARGAVTVPPDLLSGLQAALERRIGEHIGLARRAGQAVAGYAKVHEWLAGGRAALVLQAADGSAEECRRLLGGFAGQVTAMRVLDGARLGAVFGRDHIVHVAVSAGRLAESIRTEAGRLAGVSGLMERDQAGS